MAALLAPGKSQAGGDPTPGRLLVKSSGVPAQGLASLVAVDAGDLGFRFRGQLVAAETGNSAAGEIEMRAADATRVAALAGLAPPLRLDGVPIAGSFDIKADGTTMAIDKLALTVGGGLVTGQLSLASVGDRRRVEARLDAEELSVAKLLQPLLDQRLATAAVAEAAISGRASPWPDEPFDGATLDAFEGNLRLEAKRLTLADGVGLTDASLDIALAPGKVDVSRIEGACLRGRCSATLRIDKVPAGAELSGSLRVTGAALEAVGGGAKSGSRGTVGGEIKFAGKGSSPRSALSVANGRGTLELGGAKLTALWPGAIAVGADAALKAEPDKLVAALKPALAAALAGGQLPLPGSLELEIADGRLSIKPFAIDTGEGSAEGAASLDLRSLAFETEWRLGQKPPGPGEKPALPGVTVTYRGPLEALGRIEPRIASDALERELAVRRMERDVEELERLRKLDEARRREEAERQRRQFEQTPQRRCRSLLPGHRSRAPPPRAEPSSVAARRRVCLQPSSGFSPICRSGRVCWHRPWRRLAGEAQGMADRKLKLGEAGPFKFDETLFTAAMPGLHAWEPLASGALKCNAAAHDAFSVFFGEWQHFVTRRVEANMALMQQVAQSKSPEAAWSAYAGFWQKLAEDYGKELSTMTELASDATRNMAAAAQSADGEGRRERVSLQGRIAACARRRPRRVGPSPIPIDREGGEGREADPQ